MDLLVLRQSYDSMQVLHSVWLTGRQAGRAGAWADVWVMIKSPRRVKDEPKSMHKYRQFLTRSQFDKSQVGCKKS